MLKLFSGSIWLPVSTCVDCPDMAIHCFDMWHATPGLPLVAPLDAVCDTQEMPP